MTGQELPPRTVPKPNAANVRRTVYLRDHGICCVCGTEVALSEAGVDTTADMPRLAHRHCLPVSPPIPRPARGLDRVNPDSRVLERAAQFSKLFAYCAQQIVDDEHFDELLKRDREELRAKIKQHQEAKAEAEASGHLKLAAMWSDFIQLDTEFAEKHARKRLPEGFERWVAIQRIFAESHLRQMTIDIHCEQSADKQTHHAVTVKNDGRRCACGYMGYTVPM